MGARALRNVALGYLCAAGETAYASVQFSHSESMTEKLAALANLVDVAGPTRDEALESFFSEWKENKNVVDKWFAVQARSNAPDTLTRVQTLSAHPLMDFRSPNRMRALMGAFSANQAKFHDPSGAGYSLLADFVLRLDATNPQVAARLVTALGLWRKFDINRQHLMKSELERILAQKELSSNTYELASKALA